jgi:NAD(P)H-hydrate repair Nnr-like enzyme with NAD(P)H-hydrate dehydratase domain
MDWKPTAAMTEPLSTQRTSIVLPTANGIIHNTTAARHGYRGCGDMLTGMIAAFFVKKCPRSMPFVLPRVSMA